MGGASQPSTEPQIKRRGWGHRVAPHTLWPTRYNRNRLWLFYLGFFCLFSPDGEASSIRCLIFPQHSLCHKCTVCVHLPLPSLPSRVGFCFKTSDSAQTGMETRRFDCRPLLRRVAVGFVLVGTKKLRSNAGKKNKDKKETILDYYRDVNIFV